jgi:hypothetical protein
MPGYCSFLAAARHETVSGCHTVNGEGYVPRRLQTWPARSPTSAGSRWCGPFLGHSGIR